MIVYMLQDVVTGNFYRKDTQPNRRWVPQGEGTVFTDRRLATSERYRLRLQPHTTVLRGFTLKPWENK